MDTQEKLILALFLACGVAIFFTLSFHENRIALKTICRELDEAVSQAGSETNVDIYVENAWDECGRMEALPK